jgi:hypothetical protein
VFLSSNDKFKSLIINTKSNHTFIYFLVSLIYIQVITILDVQNYIHAFFLTA